MVNSLEFPTIATANAFQRFSIFVDRKITVCNLCPLINGTTLQEHYILRSQKDYTVRLSLTLSVQ